MPSPANDASQTPVTWAALLAHWTHFAQASLALPDTQARWKHAVPDIIALQAVTFAAADLDTLPNDERALGVDRAEVLLGKHVAAVHALWHGQMLPDALRELIDDARLAVTRARSAGVEWVAAQAWPAITDTVKLLTILTQLDFRGDLYVALPGRELLAGCPLAFARMPKGGSPPAAVLDALTSAFTEGGSVIGPTRRSGMRQVYRQHAEGRGGHVRDLVTDFDDRLHPGQPLLVPIILGGEPQRLPVFAQGEPARATEVVFDTALTDGCERTRGARPSM
ncbi:MAG: hypothetical protein KF866_01630 [Phycisphaeraceae bacterium]|nr:hypothetical protein [Phycisphaeraceae bacterium]MCW5754957.1 hypothetical protein [Phycisphaeraceae bacterium]